MHLVDIGANLGHQSFDHDRAQVLVRARQAGVETIVLTGTTVAASRHALELADHSDLYSTAGVHPHDAKECNEHTIAELRTLLENPRVVAVGECGLDYNRNYSPHPDQEKWFEAQVELAVALKKPLFLHERDAHVAFAQIIARHRSGISRLVVHCFTGTEAELDVYLGLDCHIGITGWICDERRGLHLRPLMKKIPLERLMLETDAPFLTPRTIDFGTLEGFQASREGSGGHSPPPPTRKPASNRHRNEPAYLTYVLKTVAESYGLSEEEVAAKTTQTAKKFFGI